MPQDPTDSQSIVQAVNSFREDAKRARYDRIQRNRDNRDAFRMIQDWSHKIDGQSKEFIPKTSEATDQFCAFVKRALIAFGDWFSIETSEGLLTDESSRRLLRCFLENLPLNGDWTNKVDFSTLMTDGCQTAYLEALLILKVHGQKVQRPELKTNGSNPKPWTLLIDLIPPDDFYQDPSGRNLYRIQRTRKDLHDVMALAEQGVYDKTQVGLLISQQNSEEDEDEKRKDEKRQEEDRVGSLSFRKQIVLDEFWGTLLNHDGTVAKENVFCTVANEKYLVRAPKDFPFWDGEDPFVVIPLVRSAFSVNHRSLADQITPINRALNELFNLILDGGIASVWGIRQLRADLLEDPTQVTNGIPQGKTLVVKEGTPEGFKVLENLTEGEVPADALAVYRLLESEFTSGSLVNELRLGNFPSKELRATEIVEASQSGAVMMDQIASDMERGLEKVLRKAWLQIVQNADELSVDDLRKIMTPRELLRFARASDEERKELMVGPCSLKVFGLTATLSRAREFQKIMAVLQVVAQNPLLLPVALKKLSGEKLFNQIFKMLNLNPSMFEKSEEELQALEGDMAMAERFLGAGASQPRVSGEAGMQSLGSEIQQEASPTAGV